VAAIVVGVSLLIGWQLARDESPGRAAETFFTGDETRYWCLALKPDDTGLAALFARINEINDATRRDLVRGTFFEFIPLPQRRARLDELAPLTLEFSLSTSDPANGLPLPSGWAARGTFSHGLFRLRAAMKLIRFMATRDPGKAERTEVDGIAVTHVHGASAGFAFANVGNRVLVASDAERMRAALRRDAEPQNAWLPELLGLHKDIAIEGEDAWAFFSTMRLGGLSHPFVTRGAAASFDVNDRDELAFRMIVMNAEESVEAREFDGSLEDCRVVISTFLPGIPVEAIAIDGDGARRGDHGFLEFSGRIAGLSERLAELVRRASVHRPREGSLPPFGRETPFAIPTPPPPPPPSDPRSDTRGEPTRGGTPKPPR
jgi:hypothetical protein